jgi:predicted nucleotidyltransferase
MQSLVEYLFRAELRGDLRFLLIGGRSLEGHGYVRATKDVDFLIATQDIPAMEALLEKVGYRKITESPIFSRWKHVSLGAEDVDLMFVNEATFEKLNAEAVPFQVGSAKIRIPNVRGLVSLKLHAIKNNPERFEKDCMDIIALQKRHPQALNLEELEQLCLKYATPGVWQKIQILIA